MRKKILIFISVLSFFFGQGVVPARASMSDAESIVIYSAVILGAVETVNLVVRTLISLTSKKKKINSISSENIQTNSTPSGSTNRIIAVTRNSNVMNNTNTAGVTVATQAHTNLNAFVVNTPPVPILIMPQAGSSTTNRIIDFSWLSPTNNNAITFRISIDDEISSVSAEKFEKKSGLGEHFWKVMVVMDQTNWGEWSELREFQILTNIAFFKSTETFTNLTESEKDDILMFGADYYYLVSLAYYGVKKYDKSREFMFHSLAIGARIEEGTKFLKETLKVKSKDISDGVARYKRSQ